MANTERKSPPVAKRGEIGASGELNYGGIIRSSEYNADLMGLKLIEIIDQMRLGDATVQAALKAVTLPILSAHWFISPASDDEQDKKIAKAVEECLFAKGTQTFQQFMREAFLYLAYGRMPFEIVYELVNTEEAGTIVGWRKFAPRHPRTISKWSIGKDDNSKPGITQNLNDGNTAEIPMGKLVIFVNDKEGDNWEGISILRPAYKHWYIKDALYQIQAAAIEKQGLGVPVGTYPKGATTQQKADFEGILRNIRAADKGYIMTSEDFKVEFLDMHANSNASAVEAIQHHDRQIIKVVLAQFLDIGSQGSSGSYSASDNQSELFTLSLQALATYFKETFTRHAIEKMVAINWPGAKTPKLEVDKIGPANFEGIVTSLVQLIDKRVVMPNNELEVYMRDIMDLPDMEEATEEVERTVPQQIQVNKPNDNEESDTKEKVAHELEQLRNTVKVAIEEVSNPRSS